jgi:hypothetical protein
MSNLALVTQDLPDFLQNAGVSDLAKQLAGRSGVKRIVPKNGIFRKVVGNEDMGKTSGPLKVVIINASKSVGRIFYAKTWTPDAEPTAPDCFSNDGRSPDKGAAAPVADSCDSCPNNIKGSGMGISKACRYSRRLAVMLLDDFGTALEGTVYQMNLASKSLFAENVGTKFAFENYTKYLANNGKSVDWFVTEISFNEDNDNQSVLFEPVGHINKAMYDVTLPASQREEVKKMVIMTPYQADMSGRALPAPKAKDVEEDFEQVAKPARAQYQDVEVIEEPKKRESKKAEPAPVVKKSLDSVVKAWSDED